MLKIYILISDFSLSTPIKVGDRVERVIFSGGCKAMRQNGEFATTDEKLQEAIENSSGFGKVYKLLKSFGETKAVKGVDPNLEEKVCRTVNEAVDWLVELGCKKSEVNTSAKAIEAANGLGFDLRFDKGE